MVTHPVELWAFGAASKGPALRLVERTDEDFVAGVLHDLGSEEGRRALLARGLPHRDGVAELFQPVHRTFYVAMMKALCAAPGAPRVEPRRIESAGLVVRRVSTPDRGPAVEAWMRGRDGRRGWVPLADQDRDPDPKLRRGRRAGHPELDRRLAQLLPQDDAAEHITPLFVAPPDVCRAAGQTIVYGLVPTSSVETSASPAATYDPKDLQEIIPDYLRAGEHPIAADIQGAVLTRDDTDRLEGRPFMTMLLLLAVSLGALKDAPDRNLPDKALELRKALSRLTIGNIKGDEFLDAAAQVLVFRREGGVVMPSSWPLVTDEVAGAVAAAMAACFEERSRGMVPNEGRFEVAQARYVARAFVRVRRDDGCPPELVWSAPSEPFRIAPWHKNGPLPPVRVPLPDVSRESVKNVKPNVAFVVPKGLAGFLNANDPKSLLKGEGSLGSGALGWICGFNIPIITICAFILLTIILTLLHIIFWWLPFVKICIPFPSSLAKRLSEE
ncbi:hypothetical protein [Sorangium sp. So ce1389]|uniref:hypothetical protein n=1 Tax=Sorangium sp. So ce1389 TaxID=3133336 RepID=UPI003F616C17